MTRRLWVPIATATMLVVSWSALAVAEGAPAHETAAEHADGETATGHDAHHVPTFDDVNWYHGILLEREGVEPSLLFRPKGMPVPFLGYVVNALALYYIVYRFARKPVAEGLARRKATIERGMKDAAAVKAEAEERLDDYEHKLRSIEEEVERVRREMRDLGELERTRVLAEARARRERMERDARLLVEQEFAAARELLLRETVQSALRSASDALKARVTPADHARLADEYLAGLPTMERIARATRSST